MDDIFQIRGMTDAASFAYLFKQAGQLISTTEPIYSTIGKIPTSAQWEDDLAEAINKLNLPYKLKEFQKNTAAAVYHGQDVFLVR
jgi:hypothetical protein